MLLLLACKAPQGVDRAATHFDPVSGTTLTEEGASVSVVGLDDVDVCYTVDGGDPGYAADCPRLDGRVIPLDCGFHTITLRWSETEVEEASYRVDAPSCVDSDEPVALWQNDELVRAFAAIQDDLRCRMNDCDNPAGTGDWSTDCGGGGVAWNVSLDGFTAISTFTYAGCEATTTIEVHDPADPYWLDPEAVLPLDVTLTLDGTLVQETDFDGNGEEGGTVEISGDFDGRVASYVAIVDAARGGGWIEAGCATGPVPGEICAPGEAMIRYDWPDWSCHGDICPEPGDPPSDAPDADGDGVADKEDVCPDISDPYQDDRDGDGLGDACDDAPGFWILQFKNEARCLFAEGGGTVSSTQACLGTDPAQQWEVLPGADHTRFRNLATGGCLAHTDALVGPWNAVVVTCEEADPFQRWVYEAYDQGGADASWPGRLRSYDEDFCLYTDFSGLVYGTWANCDLAGTDAGRKVGIYAYGDFETAPLPAP